jgi:glycosyltransferase involved in cell wall biosynthesis
MKSKNKKMNLLMISTDRKLFEEGSDVAKRQIELAKSFGHLDIICFSLKRAGFKKVFLSENCTVYPTESFSVWSYVLGTIGLGVSISKRQKVNIITCQDAFLAGSAGVILKSKISAKLEIQVHTDIGSPYFTYNLSNRIRKMLAKYCLRRADKIRVVSSRIKSYLVDKLHIDQKIIEIRPIAIDLATITTTPISIDLHKKYGGYKRIILMASRFEPEKNFTLALQAFARVLKESSDTALVLVGHGSEEKRIISMCHRFGIINNVIIEPWVDRATLFSYYKTADAFLNTSFYEGYGMTIVEARACGCTVVSTDVGIAAENGAKIVSFDVMDVAGTLLEVLNNK